MKASAGKLIVTVVVLMVLGALAGLGLYLYCRTPKPTLAKLGGVLLTYEVNVEAFPSGQPPPDFRLENLATALKRRLDPEDDQGITVTPAGPLQIEIGVPRVSDQDATLQRIRELIASAGHLEFCILANSVDDQAAIADAHGLLNPNRPPSQAKLEEAQVKGLPPPAPHTRGLEGPLKHYTINLPYDYKSEVSYRWVELGPAERRQLNLDNAARDDPKRRDAWMQLDRVRGRAICILPPGPHDGVGALLQGALFYSRECKNRNLSEQEQRMKQYDYYVLAREPEFDPATGKQTPRIEGSYLEQVTAKAGVDGFHTVAFTFNAAGGDLFGKLTRKNVPSSPGPQVISVRRHLAIVLDGLVINAPSINSEIRQHGQISGMFSEREVNQLVTILRAGALPAPLKPTPVQVRTVEPAK